MDDDGDVCRVCRSGPEPGQPLFHPCKCSGSIRHVHQACLLAWLQASRKRTCETCLAPFHFTPIYLPSRPAHLPPALLLLRLTQRALALLLSALRAALAALVWIAIVPWMSIWTLRFYLALGNTVAWTLAGKGASMPERFGVAGGGLKAAAAAAAAVGTGNQTLLLAGEQLAGGFENATRSTAALGNLLTTSSLSSARSQPTAGLLLPPLALPSSAPSPRPSIPDLLSLLASRDLYPGQQLIALVVLSLLAGFLLREWAANARVGADALPPLAPVGAAAAAAEPPAAEVVVVRDGAAERAAGVRAVELRRRAERVLAEATARAAAADEAAAEGAAAAAVDDDGEPIGRSGQIAFKRPRLDDAASAFDDDDDDANDDAEQPALGRRNPRPTPEKVRLARVRYFEMRLRWAAAMEEGGTTSGADVWRDWLEAEADAAGGAPLARPSSPSAVPLPPSPDPSIARALASPSLSPPASAASSPSTALAPLPSSFPTTFSSLPSASSSSSLGPAPALAHASPTTNPSVVIAPAVAAIGDDDDGPSPEAGPSRWPGQMAFSTPSDADTDRIAPESADELDPAAGEQSRTAAAAGGRWAGVDAGGEDDADGEEHDGASGASDDNDDGDWEDVDEQPRPASPPVPAPAAGRRRPPPPRGGPNPAPLMPLGLFRPGVPVDDEDEVEDEGAASEGFIDRDEQDDRFGFDGVGGIGLNDIEGPEEEVEEGEEEEGEDEQVDPANAALLQEEIDGLLEAAGLRGPLTGLLQNTTILTVVVSFFCALAVFLPLVLGKTLLLVDIRAAAKLALAPVALVRLTTDPVVGFFVRLAARGRTGAVGEAATEVAARTQGGIFGALVGRLEDSLPTSVGASLTSFLGRLPLASNETSTRNSRPVLTLQGWVSSTIDRLSFDDDAILGPALASLGRVAQQVWHLLSTLPDRLAQADDVGLFPFCQGDSVGDRALAVGVGYLVIACLVGVVFRLKIRTARAVQAELEPAVTVVKLGIFMLIELVLFPFFCGALLHLSALPLFVNRPTLADFQILGGHPFVAVGQHVLLGTMFMFGFANLLAFGRTALRPGVFFFIRDPSDPAFNPVNDILFKRTWPQLKKLLISAGMYATMLGSCVGLVGLTLRLAVVVVPRGAGLPLRWGGGYPPLSEIPLDLLVLHLGMPLLVGRMHPLARLKRALIAWLSATVETLRLASYFFDAPELAAWADGSDDDGEGSDDELASRSQTAAAPDLRDRTDTPAKRAVDRLVRWLAPLGRRDFMEGVGGWARVPAVDHLRILPARRMFVRLDADHAPLDAAELRLLVAINKKAVDAGRDPAADFGIVWLPGHVRSRIYLLLGALWLSCLAVGALAVGTVGIGRLALRGLVSGEEGAHDGYALLTGGVVLAGCVEVGLTTEIVLRRWTLARQVAKRDPRPLIRRLTLIQRARSLATGLFASVALVLVVPLIVGLVAETALLLPFRSSATNPAVIHLAEVWALGALSLSCLVRLRPTLPPLDLLRELDFAYGHHRFRWNAKRLARRLLGPLFAAAAAVVVGPWAVAALCSVGSTDVAQNARLSRFAHPATILAFGGYFAARRAWVALEAWVGKLHDREYLVSLRLRNQGPADDNESTDAVPPMAIPADMIGLLL